jgi:hypothetical protein
MAATVLIEEMTASTTGVDKTSSTVRFKSADETSVDTNNRISIPAASTTYSYTKQLRFHVTVAPSTDISNLRAYSDGSNSYGTGVGLQYTLSGTFASNVNTNINVLGKIISSEYDVCDAWEGTLEIVWDNVPANTTLAMRAMEENLGIGHGAPLYYPDLNHGETLGYTLANGGGIAVDGGIIVKRPEILDWGLGQLLGII